MSNYFLPHERDQLFRRLEHLQADDKSIAGCITGHETLLHLNDGLRGFLGDQPMSDESTLFWRTVGRWLVFHFMPWPEKEPKDAAGVAQIIGTAPPGDFDQDFAVFVGLLQRFDQQCRAGTLAPHPRYGKLSKSDWGAYMYLHIDWHLTRLGH